MVLSPGSPPQEKTELPLEEIPMEDNLKQAKSETKSLNAKQGETNYVLEESSPEGDLEIERSLAQGTTYEDQSASQSKTSTMVQNISSEEEVSEAVSPPEQGTQVPELVQPEEEEYLQSADEEQEEVDPVQEENEEEIVEEEVSPASPEDMEEQEASQLGGDFAFEEEPTDEEQNAESESVESTPSQKEDFAEVAEFGNTQDEDQQGPFLYDLMLSEINSSQVREKVLSILEDESLNLPLNEDNAPLKDCIKDGKLTLSGISPVQAYVYCDFFNGLAFKYFLESVTYCRKLLLNCCWHSVNQVVSLARSQSPL